MKSRTKRNAPNANGPEKVAYILPQGQLASGKSRKSGRPVRTKCYDPSGYVLIGMYDSLGKTFTTHAAAAKYAEENGFTVKSNVVRPRPRAVAQAAWSIAVALAASVG